MLNVKFKSTIIFLLWFDKIQSRTSKITLQDYMTEKKEDHNL